MEFEFFHQPPAEVQKKKKYATFTVRDIGGPEEISKWRDMQTAKESAYRMRLNERDSRLSSFEADTMQKLITPRMEAHRDRPWAQKLAGAQSERKRLARVESAVERASIDWSIHEEPKPNSFQRLKGWIMNLFKSANF